MVSGAPAQHDGGQPRRAPHRERQIVPVTEVAHRGDAPQHSGPRRRHDGIAGGIVVPRLERTDRIGGGVEDQVDMGVDETRQERGSLQVNDLDIVRRFDPFGHGDDALTVEHHHRTRPQRRCRPVVQPGRSERDTTYRRGGGVRHHGHHHPSRRTFAHHRPLVPARPEANVTTHRGPRRALGRLSYLRNETPTKVSRIPGPSRAPWRMKPRAPIPGAGLRARIDRT